MLDMRIDGVAKNLSDAAKWLRAGMIGYAHVSSERARWWSERIEDAGACERARTLVVYFDNLIDAVQHRTATRAQFMLRRAVASSSRRSK